MFWKVNTVEQWYLFLFHLLLMFPISRQYFFAFHFEYFNAFVSLAKYLSICHYIEFVVAATFKGWILHRNCATLVFHEHILNNCILNRKLRLSISSSNIYATDFLIVTYHHGEHFVLDSRSLFNRNVITTRLNVRWKIYHEILNW